MNAWELDSPLKSSRWQQGIVVACHVLAWVALAAAYLPLWTKVLAALAVLGSAGYSWKRLTHQHAEALVALHTEGEHWFITLRNGQRVRLKLTSWAVWRYVVVLDLQATSLNLNYRLIIFPDSINLVAYRRLQARLRLAVSVSKLSWWGKEV